IPNPAVTPPQGSRAVAQTDQQPKAVSHTALTDPLIPAAAFGAQPTAGGTPAPAPPPGPGPAPAPAPPGSQPGTQPALSNPASTPPWTPPTVRTPWMQGTSAASGATRRLALLDTPQPVGDRQVHFVHAANDPHVDLATEAGKIRVTFIATPTGTRILHIKGLS